MAAVAVVQGASRGLGLEFCKHILSNKAPAAVVATCRNPEGAIDLAALHAQHPGRLTVLKLDVTQEDDIKRAAEVVKKSFGKVDLIINSSAMLHPTGKGETSLRDVSAQGTISTLITNTVGPLVMAKYFAPLLQKGSGLFGQQPPEKAKQHSGIIVNMTARVGSIGDNALGGWYSYRMSKTALNMATRNLSIELGRGRPKVLCVSLHPGTLDTDLSRPYHRNVPKDKLFSTQYSVEHLMAIINSLNIDKSGKATPGMAPSYLGDKLADRQPNVQMFRQSILDFPVPLGVENGNALPK